MTKNKDEFLGVMIVEIYEVLMKYEKDMEAYIDYLIKDSEKKINKLHEEN